MLDRSNFTVKSKVKEHLRQSLEDKCSMIGGRQIFFGLNDSMLRMLTPVKEVVTPVPGIQTPNLTPELLLPENTIIQTLKNPEHCPESLSDQDITDMYRHRLVREPDVWSNIDFNDTGNKSTATQPKSVSTTKQNRRIKKSRSSIGRESDSADTLASDRIKETSRLSGGLYDLQDNKLDKKTKADKKNKKQSVFVQRSLRNGHAVTEIELPAISLPLSKKDSNDRKQKGNHYRSVVRYTNISVKCTLPPLDERSPNIAKKASKTKSNGTNEIHVLPSDQKAQRAVGGQTRTSVVTLPPIKSISGRDNLVRRGSAPEVQLTMSEHLHETREGRISKPKQKRIGTVPDNIRLPSINTNKLSGTVRANSKKERICSLQAQKP